MKNVMNKFAWCFVIVISFQQIGCVYFSQYRKLPISEVVDISKQSKKEIFFSVSSAENYAFSLRFKNDIDEREKLYKLLVGKDAYGRETNGEKTPIGIDVYKLENGEKLLKSIGGGDSFPKYATGGGYWEKLIYTDYLFAGNYVAVVESKIGNPNFKDFEVELHIGRAHRPK